MSLFNKIRRPLVKIESIMSRNPSHCHPDAPLTEVAAQMRDLGIGIIPVCSGKKIHGMITDRDIAIRAVANGLPLALTPVKQVMTNEVVCCFEDQDVREVAALMQDYQIRRLVVLNRRNKMTGMISLGDIAAKSHEHALCGEALREISLPYPLHMRGEEHVDELPAEELEWELLSA
jgi:CBS domain-containing protein